MEQNLFEKYKHLMKNQWISAGLLFVLTIAFGLLMVIFTSILHLDNTVSVISCIMAASILGAMYYHGFNEPMPKKLRRNVTVIYMIGQILLALIYFLLFVPQILLLAFASLSTFMTGAVITIIISMFIGIGIYWMLGRSNKSLIKTKETVAEAIQKVKEHEK
jgi:hypothetical protein